MNTYITQSKEMGRELHAKREFKKGDLIFSCEILVLSEADTIKVNQTDLKYYTFTFNDKQDCLVLGDGEIFNHSDTPNVEYDLVDFNDRKLMYFFAIKDIEANEQLFIDYNADIQNKKDILSEYTTNLI